VEPSKNEKSIIDYTVVRKDIMKYVRDTRIKRGHEIGSDHYLLTLEPTIEYQREKKKKKSGNCTEKIKAYKLGLQVNQIEFQRKIMEGLETLGSNPNTEDFRKEEAEPTVDKVKKKQLWQKYLTTKSTEDYKNYNNQRSKVKSVVLLVKQKSWEESGGFMGKNSKDN
jgi:hypothetical protein